MSEKFGLLQVDYCDPSHDVVEHLNCLYVEYACYVDLFQEFSILTAYSNMLGRLFLNTDFWTPLQVLIR